MATSCTSSLPAHVQSGNRLTGAVSYAKRNAKTIERQRRREMKTLFSTLRSLLPNENVRISGHTTGEVKTVADMHERKAEMASQADAFIALPELPSLLEETERFDSGTISSGFVLERKIF